MLSQRFPFVLVALLATTAGPLCAATTTNLHWVDVRELTVEGKGWSHTKDFYDRLPAKAEKIVRPAVWGLSHDSAGMRIHFISDATAISARWTLRKEQLAMVHMPASGVSGIDLYVRSKGKWRWLADGRPDKQTVEKQLVGSLLPIEHEYVLYLPLYNGIEELKLGIPEGAHVRGVSRSPQQKSIVFYGTSILQGGCASRPGMAYPAILARRLDVPHINLGFSGNAWSEPELAHLLAELDPSVYVLDPLPNMTAERVKERMEPFVKILREAHPVTPIILIENVIYPGGDFVLPRKQRYESANAELRRAYERLKHAGVRDLFLVNSEKLLGEDGEGTVDGTHPTDLGFERMANAIEPTLRKALKRAPKK